MYLLCVDNINDANQFIDERGSIAGECSTLPDKEMASREMLSVQDSKRAPVKRKLSTISSENERYL